MNAQNFIILCVLLGAVLVLGVVLLFVLLRRTGSDDTEQLLQQQESMTAKLGGRLQQMQGALADEFSRSRMENARSQSENRREMTAAIGEMSGRVEKMMHDNYAFNVKTSQTISNAMLDMQKGNEEKLEKIRMTVDEKLNETLTRRLDSSFKTVSEQLENVYKSLGEMKVLSTGVTENVTSLNRILTNVKARGTWAEVQLEGLLDQTIPGMYVKNFAPREGSRELVEFAVKIPSGDDKEHFTFMPIDSKFPVEDYIRLCDAADSGDAAGVDAARKALEARVLSQARDVKKYINEPVTTPFAIMYLATEGLYSEILSSKNGIAERCQNECGVMLAGPSTITALLNSLSIGFRAMAINEKAKEVRALLAAAKVQYEKFGLQLDKARKKIDEAGRSLDDAQSRNNIIQKKLRAVETMDRSEADELLGLDAGEE